MVQAGSVIAWRLKVLFLIAVLAYAFFKFAWTCRLQNYCSVLLGALPVGIEPDLEAESLAARALNPLRALRSVSARVSLVLPVAAERDK